MAPLIVDLLIGFGGGVVGGSLVGLVVHRKWPRTKAKRFIPAPPWAKVTSPIPIVSPKREWFSSEPPDPYRKCVACGAPARLLGRGPYPSDDTTRIPHWEGDSVQYGGPVWPKFAGGYAIQRCNDCNAHWAYPVVSEDAAEGIQAELSVEKVRLAEQRAWEELEQSMGAKKEETDEDASEIRTQRRK